jgi:hypothetical protein
MTTEQLLVFASGALTALGLTAALFFLRHWQTTRDRLFVFFAIAFVGLAASWAAMVVWPALGEHDAYVYGIRLVAFLALIVGIVDKNRSGGHR